MNAIVANLLYSGEEEMLKISSKLCANFTYLEAALRELYKIICFTAKVDSAIRVVACFQNKSQFKDNCLLFTSDNNMKKRDQLLLLKMNKNKF